MSFVDKRFYRGKISRQDLVESKEGFPVLSLGVTLEGQLVDARRPSAGILECPQVEITVSLRFNPENEESLGYAVSDLEKLGFSDEDLSKLSPDSDHHVSLLEKVVHVMPTTRVYNDSPVTFWNLRFPREHKEAAIGAKNVKNSAAAEAYKKAVKSSRQKVSSEGSPF